MASVKVNAVLNKLYFNISSPGALAGVDRLYKAAKKQLPDLTYADVKAWLLSQEAYGVYYPFRGRFSRSRVISAGIDYLWEMDLMDMQKIAKANNGYKYVLLVIDVFSRFVWTSPLESKRGEEITSVLKFITQDMHRYPKYLRSDRGYEFVNLNVRRWCKAHNISHVLTNSEVKAALAERAIKTIKGRLFRYMHVTHSDRYIHVLQKVTRTYNNTFHSSIGMAPAAVSKANENALWWSMYVAMNKHKPVRQGFQNVLPVGLHVRISLLRNPFAREYRIKWSTEIFQIYQRFARDGILIYLLRDSSGEVLKGSFYREELLPIVKKPHILYKIEKIVKTVERPDGRRLHYVKWANWDDSYNTWIKEKDLQSFPARERERH